ncbi:methionine synthase [Acrocarpospora corrugata]|uniref:Methionine synthase n=1 Tax=Acrocarpospora corrugata TaxID=35763 RepID=A0A5M3VQU7_9ACTN|nr:methionine synthase [Acrocarpospora corrugata]
MPALPTTVVGSYPVPAWMERLKTDHSRGRMSYSQLQDVHDMAIKAALLDQDLAGIDIVSDGELRRDNDIDYTLARMPGIEIPEPVKDYYFDYHEARVAALPAVPAPPLGLAADYAFTSAQTSAPIKFSFTGPFSLSCRVRERGQVSRRDLVMAMAGVLNAEARALAELGAELLQIDEPFLAGHTDQTALAVDAINVVTAGVDVTWALHVCYGNRYARPSWEGHYDFLFPEVLRADLDQLVLEFARKGDDDLAIIEKFGWPGELGLGVVDVKSPDVESPELVATRIRRALRHLPADRLMINPDCGLRNLTGATARAKLAAMVRGTRIVRAELATPTETTQGATP